MPSFLVETYLARSQAENRTAREQRARAAGEELTTKRTHVRFESSIHVLDDELCFFLFDAPTSRAAACVAERAGLDALRVVEAASSRKEEK